MVGWSCVVEVLLRCALGGIYHHDSDLLVYPLLSSDLWRSCHTLHRSCLESVQRRPRGIACSSRIVLRVVNYELCTESLVQKCDECDTSTYVIHFSDCPTFRITLLFLLGDYFQECGFSSPPPPNNHWKSAFITRVYVYGFSLLPGCDVCKINVKG